MRTGRSVRMKGSAGSGSMFNLTDKSFTIDLFSLSFLVLTLLIFARLYTRTIEEDEVYLNFYVVVFIVFMIIGLFGGMVSIAMANLAKSKKKLTEIDVGHIIVTDTESETILLTTSIEI